MALPLQPGDPVPRLPGRDATLDVTECVGRWTLLVVGTPGSDKSGRMEQESGAIASAQHAFLAARAGSVAGVWVLDALAPAPGPGWRLHLDRERRCAQRLGALDEGGEPAALVTVVDPRGCVAAAFHGRPVDELVGAGIGFVQARI
ncbi:MAG: hypothetical protein EXR79_06050 [Myxococcales bacterium]|nr:hypothetical protein [Myxococcales bacterium]